MMWSAFRECVISRVCWLGSRDEEKASAAGKEKYSKRSVVRGEGRVGGIEGARVARAQSHSVLQAVMRGSTFVD